MRHGDLVRPASCYKSCARMEHQSSKNERMGEDEPGLESGGGPGKGPGGGKGGGRGKGRGGGDRSGDRNPAGSLAHFR